MTKQRKVPFFFQTAASREAAASVGAGDDPSEAAPDDAQVSVEAEIRPQMDVMLTIRRKDGSTQQVPVLLRIDTPIEVDYYLHGGILPFVLRELLAA